MALTQQDREDLFRDGRAMPVRGETLVDSTEWLLGFRPQGQASLYAGPDLVFQFNVAGELRRVFTSGERFTAEGGHLKRLETLNRGQRLSLVRTPLSYSEEQRILDQLAGCIQRLQQLAGDACVVWKACGLSEAEFRTHVLEWLKRIALPPRIANAANVQ